jgi:hypothetical protein
MAYGDASFGTQSAAYGIVSVASGSGQISANYWATGNHTLGAFAAYAATGSFIGTNGAAFYDNTNSTNSVLVSGTHTNGFNAFGATLSNTVVGPNNAPFGLSNAAGNATIPLINLNSLNSVLISDTTRPIIMQGAMRATGSAPALTSCGTSPSIDSTSNNNVGNFTVGTPGTTCTVTFDASHPFPSAPQCSLSIANGGTAGPTYSTTITAITVSVTTAGSKYQYVCL